VIHHRTGSRANQTDEFPLEGLTSIAIGRDSGSDVSFDPERDDLVSRTHARIDRGAGPYEFLLVDLDSRNGTFHNGNRLTGSTALRPGDQIRLGEQGPSFEFDLDPRPAGLSKPTRVAIPLPATRVHRELVPREPEIDSTSVTAHPAQNQVTSDPPPIGRETVERLISARGGQMQRRTMVNLSIAGLTLLASLAGGLIYLNRASAVDARRDLDRALADVASSRPLTPADVTSMNTSSVVFLEVSWKIRNRENNELLFPFCYKGESPAFEKLSDTKYRLVVQSGRPSCSGASIKPIGGVLTGTGFIVTDAGFALTNKHVAAPWRTEYTPEDQRYLFRNAILVEKRDSGYAFLRRLEPSDYGKIQSFIPSKIQNSYDPLANALGTQVQGEYDYMWATFPKTRSRIPARLVRESDSHDVALIKIDTPDAVPPVVTYNSYDESRAGDSVTVLGYQASANREIFVVEDSSQVRFVPNPVTSTGYIGKVFRPGSRVLEDDQEYETLMDDFFQLTVNSTGTGNSGGPVFDERGRAIAIFTAVSPDPRSGIVSYAVPIKYGLELMNVRSGDS